MIKKIIIFILFLLITKASYAVTLTLPTTDGLVGYWPMNDIVGIQTQDMSGYGAHGTITGAIAGSGKQYNGLSFDGVDDYVDCGTGTHTTGIRTNLTVSMWAKYSRVTGESGGIENDVEGGPPDAWTLEVISSVAKFYIKNTSGSISGVSGGTILANVWYNLTGVYNGANAKIFVNGLQTGIGTISGLINNPANLHIYIGKYFRFNGTIDEVRIYNRALSDQEILDIYNYDMAARSKITSK